MKLLGLDVLAGFVAKHSDSATSLSAWQAEVERTAWKHFPELKQRYPSASLVGKDNVIFNIRGNAYRLHVRVSFVAKLVVVIRVGTHAEYDNWKF